MGAQLRVYRQKIKSAKTTKKITRAMELISASRIQKAQQRVAASTPYTRAVTRAVSAVASHANIDHPLKHAPSLSLADLAESRWIVYRANMPMRVQLEREFHDAGLRFPLHLVETTSILATLSLLQNQPEFVALVSIDVAQQCLQHHRICILPLAIQSVSDPYELVTRQASQETPAMQQLRGLLLRYGDLGMLGHCHPLRQPCRAECIRR